MAQDVMAACVVASARIVADMLGDGWGRKHYSEAIASGFFRPDLDGAWHRGGVVGADPVIVGAVRLVHLANLLLNFSFTRGFGAVLDKLRRTPNPEEIMSELDAAKTFWLSGHEVAFNTVTVGRGETYDFDVFIGSTSFPVEVKTRMRAASVSREWVRKTIRSAAKQLPSDRVGCAYIRIQQESSSKGADASIWSELRSLPPDFGTRRVGFAVIDRFVIAHGCDKHGAFSMPANQFRVLRNGNLDVQALEFERPVSDRPVRGWLEIQSEMQAAYQSLDRTREVARSAAVRDQLGQF